MYAINQCNPLRNECYILFILALLAIFLLLFSNKWITIKNFSWFNLSKINLPFKIYLIISISSLTSFLNSYISSLTYDITSSLTSFISWFNIFYFFFNIFYFSIFIKLFVRNKINLKIQNLYLICHGYYPICF